MHKTSLLFVTFLAAATAFAEPNENKKRILSELAYNVPCAQESLQFVKQELQLGKGTLYNNGEDKICFNAGQAQDLLNRSRYLIKVYRENKKVNQLNEPTERIQKKHVRALGAFCGYSWKYERGDFNALEKEILELQPILSELAKNLETEIKSESLYYAVDCFDQSGW